MVNIHKSLTALCIILGLSGCNIENLKKSLGMQEADKPDSKAEDAQEASAPDGAPVDGAATPSENPHLTASAYGFKTGRQLLNSYLAVTGIPINSTIQSNYNRLEISLPVSSKTQDFSAGNQSAIVNLASVVCDQFIRNTEARAKFFPEIKESWSRAAKDMKDLEREELARRLIQGFWGIDAGTEEEVKAQVAELVALQVELSTGSRRMDAIAKALCTAVASSYQSVIY